jgi:transposase
MTKKAQNRTSEFKLNLVLEAIEGKKTLVQLASENGIHPRQITLWKKQLLVEGKKVFSDKRFQQNKVKPDKEELLHIIEQLGMELDFLKKKLGRTA